MMPPKSPRLHVNSDRASNDRRLAAFIDGHKGDEQPIQVVVDGTTLSLSASEARFLADALDDIAADPVFVDSTGLNL